MSLFKRNIITVIIKGMDSSAKEEKIKSSIYTLNGIKGIKVKRNRKKLIINVEDSKIIDLSKISWLITEAGCECVFVKNY